jgi:hypothetical protein
MKRFGAAGVRAVLLLVAFVVAGAANPALSADYEELVAQARQGKVDHAALRLAYADSKSYDAYNTDLASLRGPLQKAFADGDCESVIKQGDAILEKNYVYIDAHMVLSTCHRRLGQAAQAEHHTATARGLIQAIAATGDGKSPETAFVVISVGEEYVILATRGLKRVQQSLVSKDGHSYDLMTVQNRSGETEQVYFNVDRVMRWNAERFTPKQ